MDERLQAALDGELARDDLTMAERDALGAFEARVDALRTTVGQRVPQDMPAVVMRRIRELGIEPAEATGPSITQLFDWLWRARDVRLRWRHAYALATAAAAVALAVVVSDAPRPTNDALTPVAQAGAGASIYVQFRLQSSDANTVALAGSFTDWQPSYELHETAPGVWTALLPLPPGVHDYAFVVDGERWIPDPTAPQVDDGFGGVNSRLALLEPTANR